MIDSKSLMHNESQPIDSNNDSIILKVSNILAENKKQGNQSVRYSALSKKSKLASKVSIVKFEFYSCQYRST